MDYSPVMKVNDRFSPLIDQALGRNTSYFFRDSKNDLTRFLVNQFGVWKVQILLCCISALFVRYSNLSTPPTTIRENENYCLWCGNHWMKRSGSIHSLQARDMWARMYDMSPAIDGSDQPLQFELTMSAGSQPPSTI